MPNKNSKKVLVGGVEKRKVAWVRWDKVCLPKDYGGLGVKNLTVFNVSLLSKWRWRILIEPHSLWGRILVSKYGREILRNVDVQNKALFKNGSVWWRDLGKITLNNFGAGDEWFEKGIRRDIGDGKDTRFWEDMWVGESNLKTTFPRLFSVSLNKGIFVFDAGGWEGDQWVWNLCWRRRLFQREEERVLILCRLIQNAKPRIGYKDCWAWKHDKEGCYSVKNTYDFILLHGVTKTMVGVFRMIWSNSVPPF